MMKSYQFLVSDSDVFFKTFFLKDKFSFTTKLEDTEISHITPASTHIH